MVAIAVGLVLITVMSVVYINSKSSTKRQDQLSIVQQGVRTAFEYLAFDSRTVGHLGCFTRHDTASGFTAILGSNLSNNFAIGIEGYEFNNTAPNNSYTLTSSAPANVTGTSSWAASTGATTAAIPITEISGGVGLTPGSDVLILRGTAVGSPVRLTAAVAGGSATTIPIENASTGTCPNGAANVSGFCNGSYGAITSCTSAQAFKVTTAGASLTLPIAIQGSVVYPVNGTEVFPMQTIVYYIKLSSSGTTTSLYRRILDGRVDGSGNPVNQEDELIEGVENMQVRYGVDTTPEPDGLIDGDYLTANAVGDWSRVVAVRVSLVVKAPNAIDGNLASALPTSGLVNGVTIVYPTARPFFDRRVFTTTVALRNRIAYAAP